MKILSRVPVADEREAQSIDPLEQAVTRPLIVTHAVATALSDAVAWRSGGGSAPHPAAFTAAAIATARLHLDTNRFSALQRSRTLEAVERTAKRFAVSALGRRIMNVPVSRFVRIGQRHRRIDVIIRDQRRRLHAIVLTARCDPFEGGRIAAALARSIQLPATDRLAPLTVHVYALATGSRLVFERDTSRPSVCNGHRVA